MPRRRRRRSSEKRVLHKGDKTFWRGEDHRWKLGLIEFAKELIDRFKSGEISSRLPYEFLEVIEKIKDENVLKAELKRIYLRKTKKEEERYIDKMIGAFEKSDEMLSEIPPS